MTSSASLSAVFGQSVIFTATVTPGQGVFDNGGTVQFVVDGSNYGAAVGLSGGCATIADAALSVGTHTITAVFNGDTNFTTSSGTLGGGQTVNRATPAITWATPASITYGTALSGTQLNATGAVSGTMVYSPTLGTVLSPSAGQALQVTFTPADTTDYTTASATISITVNRATPTITWTTPAPITYGTTLSATQLNATGSVTGTTVYSSVAGTCSAPAPGKRCR